MVLRYHHAFCQLTDPYRPIAHSMLQMALTNKLALKVDLSDAYYNVIIPLPLSALFGIRIGYEFYRYIRMPQGVSFAPYIYQCYIQKQLYNITKDMNVYYGTPTRDIYNRNVHEIYITNYFDDIVVMGNKTDEVKSVYTQVCNKLKENKIKINTKKSSDVQDTQVVILGYSINYAKRTWSNNNIESYKKKIYSYVMKKGKEKKLRGTLQYISMFIMNLNQVYGALRKGKYIKINMINKLA